MKKNKQHRRLGRNELCHCGSGKKYKDCCLQKDEAALSAEAMSLMSDDLQRRFNPVEAPEAEVLLRPRSSVEQQINRGELFWAALRAGGGKEIPGIPPLVSKGPFEIAEALRSPPQEKDKERSKKKK